MAAKERKKKERRKERERKGKERKGLEDCSVGKKSIATHAFSPRLCVNVTRTSTLSSRCKGLGLPNTHTMTDSPPIFLQNILLEIASSCWCCGQSSNWRQDKKDESVWVDGLQRQVVIADKHMQDLLTRVLITPFLLEKNEKLKVKKIQAKMVKKKKKGGGKQQQRPGNGSSSRLVAAAVAVAVAAAVAYFSSQQPG